MRHATRLLVLICALALPTTIVAKGMPQRIPDDGSTTPRGVKGVPQPTQDHGSTVTHGAKGSPQPTRDDGSAVTHSEKGTPQSTTCPPDVAAAVAAACPCDGPMNHGQYVSCVVHVQKVLWKAGCSSAAQSSIVRCAVQSTCGKRAAVVCCPSTAGTCNRQRSGNLSAAGVCSNDFALACNTDADCTTIRPHISHDAATCAAGGGTSAGQRSLCGACTDPPSTPTTTTTPSTTTSTSTTSSSTTTSTTSSTTATTTTSSTTTSSSTIPPTTTSSSTTTSTSSSTTTTTTTLAGRTYGNSVEFPAASTNFADYLLGSPLTIPVPSVLTHLCVIAKAAGPNVILALYSDNGGYPDRLVAATPATPMTVGPMEIPVTPTALAAGTYWIMGVYDTDASIGFDQSDPTALVEYAAHAFASPLPDPFGGATPYSGQTFNYYVRVE